MTRIIAVTGTDTGAGKTMIAATLAAAALADGKRVKVLKPVETGVPNAGPADAIALKTAAHSEQSLQEIAPYQFAVPLAPMAAARIAGEPIDLAKLDEAFAQACVDADVLIVEGAGGLLVPITPSESYATLFARWSVPTIVVAPNKLGAINHMLLTVGAALAVGVDVAGVVLNDVAPPKRDASSGSNSMVLAELLPRVTIWHFPWVESGDSFRGRDAVHRWGLV